jgi:hypothetical protein
VELGGTEKPIQKGIFGALETEMEFVATFNPPTSILQMAPNNWNHVLGSGVLSVASYSDFRGAGPTRKTDHFLDSGASCIACKRHRDFQPGSVSSLILKR